MADYDMNNSGKDALSTSANNTNVARVKLLTQNMNIHHFVIHSYKARESRTDGLIAVLDNFDIICLQEVFTFSTVIGTTGGFCRQKILDSWKHFSVVSDPPTSYFQQDNGLMILSKYPIVNSKSIFYNDRGTTELFSLKGALMADIKVSENKIIRVITTHLDARSPVARKSQINQLVKELINNNNSNNNNDNSSNNNSNSSGVMPCALTGDLNCNAMISGYKPPVSYFADTLPEFLEISKILNNNNNPLQEIRTKYGIPPEKTMASFNVCLDHIFISDNVSTSVDSFKVEKNWKDQFGNFISDHYGVSTTLEF